MWSTAVNISSTFRNFASKIPRPFTVHYNPYTQSVDILDSKEGCLKLAEGIFSDVDTLIQAMKNE